MTGDQADLFARIKRLLNHPQWFGEGQEDTPRLDALLQGPAWALSQLYGLFAYVKLQTRISTATDGFLDLIAADFFGTKIRRRKSQTDTSFRAFILANLLYPKNTRRAMRNTLVSLTGREPVLFEPRRALDTMAYDLGAFYDVQGRYGDAVNMPWQALVTAFRPLGVGTPGRSGYGDPQGAYGRAGRFAYATLDQIAGAVTDQDMIDAVRDTKPAGTRIWLRIAA